MRNLDQTSSKLLQPSLSKQADYLVVYISGPEASIGAIVGVGREERSPSVPDFIDVVDDDHGLADRSAIMDQNGDFLVHRIGL